MKVNSSNIDEITWEDQTLTVTFKNGRTYDYQDVPTELYDALVAEAWKPDGSVGTVFNRLVRQGPFAGAERV